MMDRQPMPRRRSLVEECSDVLAKRIHAGEWQDVLPGERFLSDLLHVGRDTIRASLPELERLGLITPASAGQRRRIVPAPAKSQRKGRRPLKLGILSPVPLERMQHPLLLEIDHIRERLSSKGASLVTLSPPWLDHRNVATQLRRWVPQQQCDAWVLVRSTQPVQAWFETTQIPCLIRGYPHPHIHLPHLDVDWHSTARHAAGQLWRAGHRKVGILIPTDHLGGVQAAVDGMLAFDGAGFATVELRETGTAKSIAKVFDQLVRQRPAITALVATRPRQVATLIGCAARNRWRIPEELSVLSLAWEPFLEQLVPPITGYHVDPASIARRVVRAVEQLAAGNLSPAGNPWLLPDWNPGASLSSPRSSP